MPSHLKVANFQWNRQICDRNKPNLILAVDLHLRLFLNTEWEKKMQEEAAKQVSKEKKCEGSSKNSKLSLKRGSSAPRRWKTKRRSSLSLSKPEEPNRPGGAISLLLFPAFIRTHVWILIVEQIRRSFLMLLLDIWLLSIAHPQRLTLGIVSDKSTEQIVILVTRESRWHWQKQKRRDHPPGTEALECCTPPSHCPDICPGGFERNKRFGCDSRRKGNTLCPSKGKGFVEDTLVFLRGLYSSESQPIISCQQHRYIDKIFSRLPFPALINKWLVRIVLYLIHLYIQEV